MKIPSGFDETNEDRIKRINVKALKTAEKLNRRVRNFLDDIDKNYSLSNSHKIKIGKALFDSLCVGK